LKETPIVFVAEPVCVKYVPNPKSQRQEYRKYQPEEKDSDYNRQRNAKEEEYQTPGDSSGIHLAQTWDYERKHRC